MRDQSSAIEPTGVAAAVGGARSRALAGALAGMGRRVVRGALRAWRDADYLSRRLLEAERPWEAEGPLRWQRELGGGARLVGRDLPTGSDPGEHVDDCGR